MPEESFFEPQQGNLHLKHPNKQCFVCCVKRDVYKITLAVDLSEDIITVTSDCGNLGLVAGILMDIQMDLINED